MIVKKNNKAFTLIELVVSLTIIASIFTFGYVSFRDFSRKQSLGSVKKGIVSDLRYAQQLALTAYLPTSTTCVNLLSYSFTQTSSETYKIIGNCLSNSLTTKTVNLPSGTTISAGSVTFKLLGQGTNLITPLTFTITDTKSNITDTVTVGVGGEVQ